MVEAVKADCQIEHARLEASGLEANGLDAYQACRDALAHEYTEVCYPGSLQFRP